MNCRKDEPTIPRRAFCNRLLISSAGMALLSADIQGQRKDKQGRTVFYPPVKIEGSERLLPGSFLYFAYPRPSSPAVLVRSRDGEFTAFSRKCAHLGCSIEFDRSRDCLLCPCHRGAYDARTGNVIFGPPPRPLDQIVLQIRAGGEVWAIGRETAGILNPEIPTPQHIGKEPMPKRTQFFALRR